MRSGWRGGIEKLRTLKENIKTELLGLLLLLLQHLPISTKNKNPLHDLRILTGCFVREPRYKCITRSSAGVNKDIDMNSFNNTIRNITENLHIILVLII
ncbi:hypothetical protein ACET3Z_020964 [Daucus carota]